MITVHDSGAGETFEAHRAMVLETFHSCGFPWHRLAAAESIPFQGLTVRLFAPGGIGNDSGRAYPWGEIHVVAWPNDLATTGYVFLHEAAHVLDARTFPGSLRVQIIEAMGLDPADGWNRSQAPYLERPREGFAISWSRDVRPAHWPDPGPVIPTPALSLEPGEALRWSLQPAIEPWADLSLEPETVRTAVAQLADRGVTLGMGLGVWGPGELVSRRDMALFISRTIEALEWRARAAGRGEWSS